MNSAYSIYITSLPLSHSSVSLSCLFLWRSPVSSTSSSYILRCLLTVEIHRMLARSHLLWRQQILAVEELQVPVGISLDTAVVVGEFTYKQISLCYHPDELWMYWNVFAELRGCSWGEDLYDWQSRRHPVNWIPASHCFWNALLNSRSLTQPPSNLYVFSDL